MNVSQHLLHKFKSTNEKNLITSKKMLISEFQIVFASQQNNIYGASHDNSPTKEKGKRSARCIVAPSNNWFNSQEQGLSSVLYSWYTKLGAGVGMSKFILNNFCFDLVQCRFHEFNCLYTSWCNFYFLSVWEIRPKDAQTWIMADVNYMECAFKIKEKTFHSNIRDIVQLLRAIVLVWEPFHTRTSIKNVFLFLSSSVKKI